MSIKSELLGGVVQFVSCCYVLPVVPTQLSMAGYPSSASVVVTAACCGIGSILGSEAMFSIHYLNFMCIPRFIVPVISIGVSYRICLLLWPHQQRSPYFCQCIFANKKAWISIKAVLQLSYLESYCLVWGTGRWEGSSKD